MPFVLPCPRAADGPPPTVSVVIPAYNEAQFLERALRSLARQRFRDFEVIVVDNGSADHTGAIATAWGARVVAEPRKGVGAARNRGCMAAHGAIIATTDADTQVPDTWLEQIVTTLTDQAVVAVGGLARLSSGPLTARLAARWLYYPFLRVDKWRSGGWNLCGNNMAVRRRALVDVGGFRTDLVIGEDVELSARLRQIGQVMLDPQLVVQTSGRRYRAGLVHGLLTYAPSTVMRLVFRQERFLWFSDVRDEAAAPRWPLLAALLLVVVLRRRRRRTTAGAHPTADASTSAIIRAAQAQHGRCTPPGSPARCVADPVAEPGGERSVVVP